MARLTRWRAAERGSNAAKVDDNSLDAVSFPFNLGLKTFHLVAVERVGDILKSLLAGSHRKFLGLLTRRILRVAIMAAVVEYFKFDDEG